MNFNKVFINPAKKKIFQKQMAEKGFVKDFHNKLHKKDGTEVDCLVTVTERKSVDGVFMSYQCIIRDVTEQLRRDEELKVKTSNLEEVNIALRVLLKKREEDKTELEEKVLLNTKELVLPYLRKLKESRLDRTQTLYLQIIESHLNDIISPFASKLSSKYLALTPREIRIASLVKQGRTNKEISELFHSSPCTIAFHRGNIRKKLGLKNQKKNLETSLISFSL